MKTLWYVSVHLILLVAIFWDWQLKQNKKHPVSLRLKARMLSGLKINKKSYNYSSDYDDIFWGH